VVDPERPHVLGLVQRPQSSEQRSHVARDS
jgi:hypothetical protein